MVSKRWLVIAVLVLLSLIEGLSVTFLLTNTSSAAPHRQGMITLVGKLGVLHHDPGPGSPLAYHYDVTLMDQAGNITPLILDISTASRLQDKTVQISGHEVEGSAAGTEDGSPAIQVESISVVEDGDSQVQSARISGNYPFVNILCRVTNGTAANEQPISYFTGLFSASYPGINHYWQQMSGGLINVTNTATFGWYTLSGTSSSYNLMTSAGRQALYNECTGLADAQVNFANYSGVNIIINHPMQNVAYGGYGGYPLNRDGVSWYRYTWLPSWAWQNESPFVHEMGHAFGMPHSSGPYSSSYDSQWDVMSDTWGSCGRPGADDLTYGCLPQGTNSFHLDYYLSWMPAGSKITVSPGQTQTVTLERLNQPSVNPGYRMIQVPLNGVASRFYVIEARRATSSPNPSQYYDAILPANGVIIHDVLNNGTRSQPAQVVDIDNNSNPNDAAAQWTPGEVFTDNANGITMRVLSQTNTGYTVQVSNVYGDTLARFNNTNGSVSLVSTLLDTSSYINFPAGAPVTGQWLMGDWNGDGLKTPGLYGSNGVFYFTNSNTTTSTWDGIWVGLIGRPAVAGRFTSAANDCLGVVDSGYYAGYGTAFALYFTCNFTSGPTPALTFQWLSVVLGDSAGFAGLGAHQFAAGDFNGDGIDTIAVRRGPYVAFTNVPPTTLGAAFDLAQYFGTPSANDYGIFLSGDWNNDAIDSFGIYYGNGDFYRRNDVQWNTGQYSLQRVSTTIGTSSLSITSWRPGGAAGGGAGGQSDTPASPIATPTTIESDDPLVKQDGAWQFVNSPESSGGGYVVTTSPEQNLEYNFNGTSVEVIYAQLSVPASFTILVDEVAVRTVILPDATTAYRQSSLINYLEPGDHTLRIVSLSGPVAVDAFTVLPSDANGKQTTP